VLEGWASGDPYYENITTVLAPGGCGPNLTCSYLLAYLGPEALGFADPTVGLLLAAAALLLMCGCLLTIVHILNSVLGGRIAGLVKTCINADLPHVPWLTGYLAMMVGALLTFLLQSSSVFTSTLTPLAGAGLVSLERAYPLTLGSNIGTTTTSIIASLAADSTRRQPSLQIALVHLFFNLSGMLVFYVIPAFRYVTRTPKVGTRYFFLSPLPLVRYLEIVLPLRAGPLFSKNC
jgi:sodium-dependent phosphate cotransporter